MAGMYCLVSQPGSMAGVLALCHNLAQWLVYKPCVKTWLNSLYISLVSQPSSIARILALCHNLAQWLVY